MSDDKLDENQEKKDNQNSDVKDEPKANSHIISRVIDEEMKTSYLDYAMSVIIGRALPDARDGLKPVHRRILFSMVELGLQYNKSFRKCARIVGDVLGKYHPHGDSSVYEALVRMAQNFSLRYPLVNGQGNFGSIDGDSPAAMRYTEAKMNHIADELIQDIFKDTVDFVPNFDESLKEPSVLPAKLPCLLVNGSSGIAVGMATNIPPHNIKEVCNAAVALIDNPEIELSELVKIIPGPDFPTGGIITRRSGLATALSNGKGIIRIRGRYHQETIRNKQAIVITEVPYMVNKAMMIEHIANQVKDKVIEGISDIRDESDRTGIRVVIELKRDATYDVVENYLLKHSRLQVSFGINMLAIYNKKPITMGIIDALNIHINHRIEVITRRTQFDLTKAEAKLHLLKGLVIALNNLDDVVKLIKGSDSVKTAKEQLMNTYELSEIQSQAILDLKLQKLTSMEQGKIKDDLKAIEITIQELRSILSNEERIKEIIKQELNEMSEKYGDERRTEISDIDDEDIDIEDLVEEEDQIVMITNSGYIKRMRIEEYKIQHRGGKGVIGMQTKDEDFIEDIFIANTKSYLLCCTEKGKVHWVKVYRIPEGSRLSKGKAIVNLLDLEQDDSVTAIIPIKEFSNEEYLCMITKNGIIKKTSLMAYSKPRHGGIRAITLDDSDALVKVLKTNGNSELIIASSNGKAIRFNEINARSIGRTGRGVRAMTLTNNDTIIGAIIAAKDSTILTITEKGYGKRTPVEDYRLINRGGKGVKNIICNPRNGKVIEIRQTLDNDELIIMSKHGQVLRTKASQISVISRNTQGCRLMRLNEGDSVTSIAKIIGDD